MKERKVIYNHVDCIDSISKNYVGWNIVSVSEPDECGHVLVVLERKDK